jgi:hypothetical protein
LQSAVLAAGLVGSLAACSAGEDTPTTPVTVTGTVQNENTAPVAGCIITPHSSSFDGRELGIVSGRDGFFIWPGITPGTYTFEAQCFVDGSRVAAGESGSYDVRTDSNVSVTVQ